MLSPKAVPGTFTARRAKPQTKGEAGHPPSGHYLAWNYDLAKKPHLTSQSDMWHTRHDSSLAVNRPSLVARSRTPSRIARSNRSTAHPPTRRRTSPRPGSGTGIALTRNGPPASSIRAARMVAGDIPRSYVHQQSIAGGQQLAVATGTGSCRCVVSLPKTTVRSGALVRAHHPLILAIQTTGNVDETWRQGASPRLAGAVMCPV